MSILLQLAIPLLVSAVVVSLFHLMTYHQVQLSESEADDEFGE